ncbi:hypothetical protein HNR42_002810 [Deinobacterium chartae]|uniref:LTXXQ motif family protein n=1 Tax=Deinobacterium chartae TaxID=521158 RepID=A0A841I510_9DEIO|nr:hypothetical protein [Deinobacterium chartae]MBB6099369.1 hypothetical protein [Deinobacterium chartae]
MFRNLALLTGLVLLTAPALAQTPAAPASASARTAAQKSQSVLDLLGTVELLGELHKNKKTAFSAAQVKALLPVLTDLSKRAELKPADAAKILTNLEERILTPQQLTRLDDLLLQREEQRRLRLTQGGTAPRIRTEGPLRGGQPAGNPRPQDGPRGSGLQGQPGPGRIVTGRPDGQPLNPFKQGRPAEQLQTLIALLKK